MKIVKKGDLIGSCPSCEAESSVFYESNGEALCQSCGVVLAITFDEDEIGEDLYQKKVDSTPPPAPAPAPILKPKPIEVQKPIVQQAGVLKPHPLPISKALTPAPIVQKPVVPAVLKSVPEVELKKEITIQNIQPRRETIGPSNDLPEYITRSRPWRWAHELQKTGNPYRNDTRNFTIFDKIEKSNGMMISAIVKEVEPIIGDKPSYLLTVYEVVTQCVSAGLLANNKGFITVCKKIQEQPPAQ